jgi:hypothetical protein
MGKKKRPDKPRWNGVAVRLADLPASNLMAQRQLQRANFIGALKYERGKRSEDKIDTILAACLREPLSASRKRRQFFAEHGIDLKRFRAACAKDWHFDLQEGDYVLSILKLAGYEGTIDDLWLSVHGKWKPSKPEAYVVEPGKRSHLGRRPWWATHGARTVNTGQTRKPGSRRA